MSNDQKHTPEGVAALIERMRLAVVLPPRGVGEGGSALAEIAAAPQAVSPADAEPKTAETGWLIEAWDSRMGVFGARWFALRTGECEPGWITDSTKALRFARKADADAYIADIGWTEAKATEHGWA